LQKVRICETIIHGEQEIPIPKKQISKNILHVDLEARFYFLGQCEARLAELLELQEIDLFEEREINLGKIQKMLCGISKR